MVLTNKMVKKYIAYIKQDGEGCDYTIGCAQTVKRFEANSFEEAEIKLKEIIDEDYSNEEFRLEFAELFEINKNKEIDLEALYNQIDNKEEQEQQKLQEQKERKEYERLKNKFE